MFKFEPYYNLVECTKEGKRYTVNIEVTFEDCKGNIIPITDIEELDRICINEEEFNEYILGTIDYFTNKGNFICEIRDDEFYTYCKGTIFATFYTHNELEKLKSDKSVMGCTIMAKEIYCYDRPGSNTFKEDSLGFMEYQHNETWRNKCLELFKSNLTENSNFEVTEYIY